MKISPILNNIQIYKPIKTTNYYLQPLKNDLVSFGAKEINKEDAHNLKNIKDLPCAGCGKMMISEEEFDKFKAKDFEGQANQVLKKLKPYSKKMRRTEKTIYNLLCRTAKKYPDADLQTLLQNRYYFHIRRLEEKQLKVLNKIQEYSKELSQENQKSLFKIQKKAEHILFTEDKTKEKKRSRIIAEFQKLNYNNKDNKIIKKIQKTILELPSSQDDIDAFVIKYRFSTNAKIGKRLLITATPSLDHAKAQSKNGKNKFKNLIVLCKLCNVKKQNGPFGIWLNKNPKAEKNIQKNIDRIIKEINDGKLENFDKYPIEIKETLKYLTKNNKKTYKLKIEKLNKEVKN